MSLDVSNEISLFSGLASVNSNILFWLGAGGGKTRNQGTGSDGFTEKSGASLYVCLRDPKLVLQQFYFGKYFGLG